MAGGLAGELREAVERGDAARVRDLVAQASEKERRAAEKDVNGRFLSLRYSWNAAHARRRKAAVAAWCGTVTARQVASEWFHVDETPGDHLHYEVIAARGRRFVETVARNTVEDGVLTSYRLVRWALRAGLIEAPADRDAYVRGMVTRLGWGFREGTPGIYDSLVADPELLEDELWAIFEIDCGGELASANEWTPGGERAFEKAENRWQAALLRLSAEGRIDRARLLDVSLDALQRDFRPSTVGWYAKLHEALEPTPDERRERIESYLALLAGPAPAAMKQGLTGLRAIEADVPATELARAAAGPLSQKQKNLAVTMLRLLEGAAERDPASRPELLDAVALALGHERPDVQERALGLLERYAEEAPQAALLGLAETVAPQLRSRAQALTGIEGEPEQEPELAVRPPGPPPEPVQPRMSLERLRAQAPPLRPVESVDELIELAARLLEGHGAGDDVERLLEGVSRLCDERPPGFERRTAGLRQRVEEGETWGFGTSARVAMFTVVSAWVTGRRRLRVRFGKPPATLLGFLTSRAVEVAARAARGNARPLLAFPTHAGGWLDPDVLAERERGFGRFLNRPGAADQLQAGLRTRMPDDVPIPYARRVATLREWGRERRSIDLGAGRLPAGLGTLDGAVAAVGAASKESIWLRAPAWGSWDRLGSAWSLTVLPAHPEVAFAGAAQAIGESLDANPQLNPEPALEHALDPAVPLSPVAWLAVAGALVAKAPDLHRLATDVLVASIDDARFDADAAGEALAWLAGQGLAKVSRLEGPLRDAGRASPLHAAQVVRLTEALLAHLGATPHGLHASLEAALEHATTARAAIERTDARTALERIAGEVSKLGRLARGLLEKRRARRRATRNVPPPARRHPGAPARRLAPRNPKRRSPVGMLD